MSRRGYNSSELYEERDREYYAPRRGGRTAEYDEIDIRERRRAADREPEFLREDYGRSSNAGPLVLRDDQRSTAESRPPRNRDRQVVETDEVFVSRAAREPQRDRPRTKPVERSEVAYHREKASSTVAATAGREYSEHDEIVYRERERFSPPPQQVAREREEFIYRQRERSPPQIAREREEFVFRPRPREPSYEREEIIIREGEREKERPREREHRDEEIIIRREEKERERPRERERERDYREEEIVIRRDERDRERLRPRARSYERESLSVRDDRTVRSRSRDFREEDIIIRRGEGERPRPRTPPRDYREEDITIRRSERESTRAKSRERGYRDDELIIRERDKPRERSRGRFEDEDIIIRHDENDKRHKDEIIIRRNERSPSPEPYVPAPPLPPPEPEPVRAPPIHQEIITHHRHIDHGFERAHVPTPPPPAPAPRPRSPSPKEEFQQIEIRRHGDRNGRHYDEDIIIDSGPRRNDERALRRRSPSPLPRRRSPSPAPTRSHYGGRDEREIAEEAAYYNDRARERSYIGEGYNGATKDWAIVDVPPGTRRVEMEGIGGAHQEVTWQRYNGVRRSKFIAEEDSYGGELIPAPAPGPIIDERDRGRRFVKEKSKTEGMWTEITKDLVSEEAIKEMGYEFEDSEFFYYIMTYLRYEDVQRLVDLSEDIKRGRRERIREMQWERERPRPKPLAALPWDEERIVEREVIYDGPPPRRYR